MCFKILPPSAASRKAKEFVSRTSTLVRTPTLMFGSSVAAFLATFWLLASMLLDIGTTNLFRATLTLFMLATSYFLSSYACKTRDDRCLSMQTELDATKKDAAEERVSMQAKLDAAKKNAAEERVSNAWILR